MIILSIHIFVWMLKVQLLWIPFLRLPCEIYNQPWDKNLERTHRRQIVELVTVSVPKIYVQWCCIGETGLPLKLSSPRSIAKMSLQKQFHHPWKIGKNILHRDKVTHSSPIYTANIYSHFTVIGCVTSTTVIWKWLSQSMTVHKTFNDTEEYSLRSITILGCNICSQITVAHIEHYQKLY